MTLTDTATSYGLISRLNHWLLAIVALAMLGAGLYFSGLPDGDEKSFWLGLHISTGALAFVLVVVRIAWRALNRQTQPFPQPRVFQVVTNIVHGVLVLALLVMVITGPLTVWTKGFPVAPFGLFTIASPTGEMPQLHEALEQAHAFTAWIVIAALGLHVLGMVKHLVFERSALMGRMVGNPQS